MVRTAIRMPLLGDTVSEGTIVRWLRSAGDRVEVGEPIFEVTTDKVDSEVDALQGGTLVEILVPEGETAPVGAELAVIEVANEGDPGSHAASPARTQTDEIPVVPTRAPASTSLPARAASLRARPASADSSPTQPAALAAGADSRLSESTVVPHSPMRRAIGSKMINSLHTAAHTLVVMEADYGQIEGARRAAPPRDLGQNAAPLTYLPFVCRAVIEAIRRYPLVNAHVREDALVVFDAVHLGIAVDLDLEGLIVPVIRNAGSLRLRRLANDIAHIAERARQGQLSRGETDTGTITITNSGSRGSLLGRPVINLPQAAIIETDLVEDRVVAVRSVDSGPMIQVRRRGYLSMSYDHRAFDGAYACAFLRAVCQIVSERDWAEEVR